MNDNNDSFPQTTRNTNELFIDEIHKMKKRLEGTSPYQIINEALESANNLNKSQGEQCKKDELLQLTKANAIKSYLENIQGKSINDTIIEFNKKTDEYNAGMQVIIDKTHKESNQILSQFHSLNEQIALLESEKKELIIEYNKLKNQLINSEFAISKLQTQFELYKQYRELFDCLFNEYPNLTPNEIMHDIKVRKNESTLLILDNMNALKSLEIIRKDHALTIDKYKKQIEFLVITSLQNEEKFKEKLNKNEMIINTLNNDLSKTMQYKEENIIMKNALYSLYNRLVETFALHRGLTVNPELDIKEDDFNVDMLNDEELIKYIMIMIKSFHFSSSDKLLRETIAYANMMIRTFMPEKINKRFEPVEVFKEIKRLLETKHDKNLKHENETKMLKKTIDDLEYETKKHKATIEFLKKQMQTMKASYIRDKQTLGTNGAGAILKKANIVCVNKSDNIQVQDIKGEITINEIIKENKPKSKPTSKSKTKRKYKSNEPLMLNAIDTNDYMNHTEKTVSNRKALYSHTLNKRTMLNNLILYDDQGNRIIKKKSLHVNKTEDLNDKHIQSKNNTLTEESLEQSENSTMITPAEMEQFKNLTQGNHKDKLIKSHGFQSFVTHVNEFKDLVNHTNRIFFYKAKMGKGKDIMKVDNLNRKVENRFLDLSIPSEKNESHQEKNDALLDNHFKSRILKNIDNMIGSINTADR